MPVGAPLPYLPSSSPAANARAFHGVGTTTIRAARMPIWHGAGGRGDRSDQAVPRHFEPRGPRHPQVLCLAPPSPGRNSSRPHILTVGARFISTAAVRSRRRVAFMRDAMAISFGFLPGKGRVRPPSTLSGTAVQSPPVYLRLAGRCMIELAARWPTALFSMVCHPSGFDPGPRCATVEVVGRRLAAPGCLSGDVLVTARFGSDQRWARAG